MSFSMVNSGKASSISFCYINGTKKSVLYTSPPDKWSIFTGVGSVMYKYNEIVVDMLASDGTKQKAIK
jgi:hypothetical protein